MSLPIVSTTSLIALMQAPRPVLRPTGAAVFLRFPSLFAISTMDGEGKREFRVRNMRRE